MRILLWAPYGAGEHYWGPGMNAYKMYSSSRKKRFSIDLAHGFKRHKDYELYDQQFFIADLGRGDVIHSIPFLYKAKKWIEKNAKNYDVVHILGAHHVSFLPGVWFENCGIPCFLKITSLNSGFSGNSRISKLFKINQYRLARANDMSGYISISKAITNELISANISEDKIKFIPNGVDTHRFSPVDNYEKNRIRNKLGIADKFTVLFTGGLSQRKNPFQLVRAFDKFKGDQGIQLLIVGPDRDNGLERDKITNHIEDNKIDNIHLIPFCEDIECYYQASDLFILPSKKEGLSNSLLEAQSCGIPSLVTKISGSEDVVKDNFNGKFISLNGDSIAGAIEDYRNCPEKVFKHSKNAVATAQGLYCCKHILESHLLAFSEVHVVDNCCNVGQK